jgi:hypothetical protein
MTQYEDPLSYATRKREEYLCAVEHYQRNEAAKQEWGEHLKAEQEEQDRRHREHMDMVLQDRYTKALAAYVEQHGPDSESAFKKAYTRTLREIWYQEHLQQAAKERIDKDRWKYSL